nr:hypothetical protein GCM10020063_076280 [Dactylosporangium thailandense]
MGWYGTLLLARPGNGNGNLPAYPGVRQSFGSQFCVPSLWPSFGDRVGLYDLGDGWQRVGVLPFGRERLRLAAGVRELAAATAAPVLAGWVSESVCAHLEAHSPEGAAVSMHPAQHRRTLCMRAPGRPARTRGAGTRSRSICGLGP